MYTASELCVFHPFGFGFCCVLKVDVSISLQSGFLSEILGLATTLLVVLAYVGVKNRLWNRSKTQETKALDLGSLGL